MRREPHPPRWPGQEADHPERVQKILSRAGYGSRRDADALVAAGRVRVNGELALPGAKADAARDTITVDGVVVRLRAAAAARRYIALYKPRGVLSDNAPGEHRTVLELIPDSQGLYPVGRLDLDSEGLILLTDDGDLAQRLSHPRYEHEKEYEVLVAGEPDDEVLERWRRGIMLEDPDGREPARRTRPAQVERLEARGSRGGGRETWLRVVLQEGRKRQIRRVAQALGCPARRIVRVRIGPIRLLRLKPGEWRILSAEEVKLLQQLKREAR
jgi:23S rRNA pseudouridine2605 synthase